MKKPHGNTGKQHALRGVKPMTERTAFRLPTELKQRAEKSAVEQGISTSQLYVKAVENYLG